MLGRMGWPSANKGVFMDTRDGLTETVTTRLTPDERDRLVRVARAIGLTPSAYLRGLTLGALSLDDEGAGQDSPAMIEPPGDVRSLARKPITELIDVIENADDRETRHAACGAVCMVAGRDGLARDDADAKRLVSMCERAVDGDGEGIEALRAWTTERLIDGKPGEVSQR